MTPFIVKNAAGEVIRYGHAPESMIPLQAQEGETVEVGEYTGEMLQHPPLTFAGLRANAYPPVGDQLDALWKGGDAFAEMQKRILAVKAAHPKPLEGETA